MTYLMVGIGALWLTFFVLLSYWFPRFGGQVLNVLMLMAIVVVALETQPPAKEIDWVCHSTQPDCREGVK